ncbi:class I SAM-dependent methyltransferase [Segetibacter sp.]|jgi:ubiquinone/menaquinone biosynthesis C-methylase UbiE|uniref:class I SAM-dependent methyltransferase n=1 Tax=Segetibacter sp. TaxID=2231182 RepID=UPI002618B86E|nr:class I SAM-dependent methyltransferase [Segetibacter sp.]MCW3082237.1 methyltransferase [Segetibacter sp.]
MATEINHFIKRDQRGTQRSNFLEFPIGNRTEGLEANAYYFNRKEWAEEYLTYCHRSDTFKSRWKAAMGGSWDNKVVVDIGCGPGNIYATLQGSPKTLIGIDVAPGSLELASKLGYTTVLADANDLPFESAFADIVTLNATLHHCVDMAAVLKEAARLVKPGGLLITDHDPQHSAWNYKGIAKLLWNARLLYYRYIGHGFHKTSEQQKWGLACEIHHKPGHGVTEELFKTTLEPLGFTIQVFPHNHTLGAEVLQGLRGKAELKYKLGNVLSGRNPSSKKSALTLMCVAKKTG